MFTAALTMYIFSTICLQLLLLTNIVQSYLILTANFEDLKNLAEKFFSESMAEQIAEFIVGIANNAVSDENEQKNDGFQHISTVFPNRYKKITRQRNTGKAHINKSKFTDYKKILADEKHTKKKHTIDQQHYGISKTNKVNNYYSQQGKLKDRPYSKYSKNFDEPYNKPIKEEYNKENRITIDKQKQLLSEIDFTTHNSEKYGINRNKHVAQNKMKHVKTPPYTEKLNEMDDDIMNKTKPDANEINPYIGFKIDRSHNDVTTKKAKNEFDQYDNPKYPTAKFIATSGPLKLPRISTEDTWWEKELPKPKDEDSRSE